ncbi:MAG: hypothetical protein GHCLOJNM_04172 [bacterium]|nr:hypothetical protein [bacterium]
MRDPSSPVPFLFSKSGWLAVVLFVVALALAPTGVLAQNSADLNRSGMVDSEDLLLLNEQWHTSGFVPVPDNPAAQANSQITGVVIPGDNKPEVTFTFTDGNGNPIPLNRIRRARFLFARIEEDNLPQNRTHYVNYILNNSGQPTTNDGGGIGNLVDLGGGVFKFKFSVAIAITNPALTHTVGGQLDHDFDRDGTTDSYANPLFNFRPDGNPVTVVRELSSTETCNECHNVLALHGGGRREYGLCILCHNPGVIDPDTGETVDMAYLVHQIHLGSAFQGANNVAGATDGINSGTPYVIVGNQGSIHNYEHVVFPQDVRNCETCHTGAELKGIQENYYKTVPSQRACSGCHDKTNANTGVNHAPGAFPDTACAFCHTSVQVSEFDLSIPGAHVVPKKSASLPKIIAEILNVANVAPGATPTVTFKLSSVINNVTSTINPGDLNSVAVTMAGPTTDYNFNIRQSVTNANSVDNGNGTRSYSFTSPVPSDVTGTLGFAMEARGNAVTIGGESVRAAAQNPVVYVELAKAVHPRREVIDWNKCLKCHDVLSLHGDNRNEYMFCVMCHRPNGTDISRRPAGTLPEETIDFRVMIHKIHSGEELEKPYTVYGFGNTPHDYTEVLFPGNRRDCESCHRPGTYDLPLPEGLANVAIIGGVTDFQPINATCISCHDNDEAAVHMESMIALSNGIETCVECHGPAERWSVDVVHFDQD